jgi:hypothetical protein
MAKLSAHEVPISKIFSSEFQFSIPDYQRPYSWGTEQALQLLADLTDALDRDEDTEPYFLGSAVLVKDDETSASEVIDGQQRLTTLTILLAALAHLVNSSGVKASLERMIREPGDELSGLVERPRLDLRPRDRQFFAKYVQGQTLGELAEVPDGILSTDAQRNIRDNAAAILEQLEQRTDAQLVALAKLLTARTYLVVVATPNLSSAHRIFNVMNSRGLDLSAADIFKSRVIGDIEDDEDREDYGIRWEDAEQMLGRQAFQDLFLHIRVIFAKTRAQREILQEFPAQVLDQFLPSNAREFVDDVVVPYADKFAVIENESYSWPTGAEEVNGWLKRLNQVDNNDWKPVALWLLRQYEADPLSLAGHLQRLERLAASMLVRRAYATPRATRYANLIRSLEGGLGLESPEYEVSDIERVQMLRQLQAPIYEMAAVRKYVLLRLNEMVASAPVAYSPSIISVEHVLPQNPGEGSQWDIDFTEDERRTWVHRLANLVLLDKRKNSEAQNYDFAVKKDKYFKSATGITPFPLTMGVIATDKWTVQTLEARQANLVMTLAKNWEIERTIDGADLAGLSDLDLAQVGTTTPSSDPTNVRVTLAQLISAGLLKPGERLSWHRPRIGATYFATVTETGTLRLDEGGEFDTPSRAAREAADIEAVDGWVKWKMADGTPLAELWNRFRGP